MPGPQRGAALLPLRPGPVKPAPPAASPSQGRTGIRSSIGSRVAALPPAAFSIVMATGIVSVAADLMGLTAVAWVLLALNIAAYLVIAALTILRLARALEHVRADLRSHDAAPGFFTAVAGTCVLGSEILVIAARPDVALGLWILGTLLWSILIYTFFTLMTVRREKPRPEEALSGGWMLIVVATQAVSVLGTLLAHTVAPPGAAILGFTTALFLIGCMLYVLLFSLIVHRFLFFPFDPEKLTPPYWINMGAVAITTLAGSLLVIHAPTWAFLREILPFLKGFTLLFWATATWWIPLLLVLGAWRHIARRVPLRYDLNYWSMVFPLGMYAVATLRLAEALGWPPVEPLARAVGALALAAWSATAVGLLGRLRG
ncbi:MAG TPA: tellurite resistance/C4-dicarboxylate transporter family protein [Longimicrobiales bacterium]